MFKKPYKSLLALLLIVVVSSAFYAAHFLLPQIMVKTGDPVNKLRKLNATYQNPLEAGLSYDSITVKSFDGLNLMAYYIPTQDSSPKATLIMLHGIRAYKEHFLPIAKILTDSGYNVLLPDNRAHGDSEGDYCTFGVKEKNDVSAFIDYLVENYPTKQIGVWGQSLGGAIALQSMSFDSRIEFGIIESTFSNLKEVSHDYIDRLVPLIPRFYQSYIIHRGSKLADFELDSANPKDAAITIKKPVLLVHGTADDRINIKYSLENLEALGNENTAYLPISDANHVNVWQIGGDEYFANVFDFIGLQAN